MRFVLVLASEWLEPTSVELHPTGTFEGRSTDWATAPRLYLAIFQYGRLYSSRIVTVLARFEAHEGRVDGELVALLGRNVARVEGVAAGPQDVRPALVATDGLWNVNQGSLSSV